MLTRRNITAGLGISLAASSAMAEAITPVSVNQSLPPATTPAPPDDPVLILDASLDDDDRLTVEVEINGQGPFNFVVDTGAGRSVLTPAVAEKLNLPAGPQILIHGISSAITSPTARIDSMRAGEARLGAAVLPVLPYERVGADGLLGVDILDRRNVVMDFRKRKLLIRRSQFFSEMTRKADEVSVPADARFGRLTLTDARIAGTRSVAFIDSGGGISIGNMALQRAIAAKRRRASDLVKPARLLTAGGEVYLGEFRVVPSITMGNLHLTNIPMAFADVHIFDVWSLNHRPAALLGADVLKLFAKVELDFGSDRVLFKLGQRNGLTPIYNV
ncbi:retropepsin-like aspartic protease [Caulobacter sp. 602-1]|uniref:retropepsin-like aspartic protease n=1 Tax=Caulobacter sp. 602-1 TaxID=2492472 RepID=UPI000F62C611|nr:retropepsin-like aspartic protease [Caulobacter sp. 602-1]RRN63100.1 peptidase A2A [Caulobacter sp. 602-1]